MKAFPVCPLCSMLALLTPPSLIRSLQQTRTITYAVQMGKVRLREITQFIKVSSRSPSLQHQVSGLSVGFFCFLFFVFHYAIAALGRHETELPSQHRRVKLKAPWEEEKDLSLGGKKIAKIARKKEAPTPAFCLNSEDPVYYALNCSAPNLLCDLRQVTSPL